VILTAVLAVFRPPFLTRLDNSVYDILLRSTHTKGPGQSVAIVDVDDRSLSTIGQWPWRRDVVGRLITRLRNAGASVIAVDIIFAESDRYGQPGDSEEHSTGEAATTPDAALVDALRDGRVILGYGLTFDAPPHPQRPCVLHPIGIAIVQPSDDTKYEPLFHATSAVCNLPALAEAAAASGFLNAAPDPDGILARAFGAADGRVYPSLALAAVAAATGARDIELRIAHVNASMLTIDKRTVPIDGKGNLLLRYRGKKRTFPYYSAADVLTDQIPVGALRGKIVFVGTTALGTREVVATPLDTLFAGVEVQATVADNLLEQDFIRRSALGTTLETLVVLVLGASMAALVAEIGITSGLIGAAASVAAFWWGTVWLLSARGLFISPLTPTTGVLAALAVMTLAKFTIERGRADTARAKGPAFDGEALLSLTEAETRRLAVTRAEPNSTPVCSRSNSPSSPTSTPISRTNGSNCCRASRLFTTSERWEFAITSSTSPVR
jgi:adenylate cyclase